MELQIKKHLEVFFFFGEWMVVVMSHTAVISTTEEPVGILTYSNPVSTGINFKSWEIMPRPLFECLNA